MLTSFVALAKLLPLFSAKNETNQQKLVAAIRHWLEQCKQRWLLIFDNADEISLIREYLPRQGNGSILLTTRADAVGSLAASVEVTNMGLIEGTEFLLRRAQHHLASDEERDEATNVAIALDCFPLALDQAGAYIEETGCSFVEYLKVYQDHWKELLARRGEQATRYPSSVATTWSLSFQKVEQANPAAAELLHLCAYLSPDRIPEELIRDGAIHWKPPLQQAVTDLFTFNQMIEELLKFSLVKRLSETHMLSIHRLVQVVQMDLMDQEEQRHWAERVIRAVNAVFPLDPQKEMSTWPQCLRYLEQAQACDRLIQQHAFVFSEAADLLERVATYLREHASYALAEPLYTRALSIREQHTASNLNDLAVLYRQQSKYVEAEPLYQRSLHIWEHQLGPEHPEVATSLNNLALLYDEQGKYTEAEPLYQHALRIWEQLGAEHPHVANPLNGLANLYHLQRKYTEAEPLYQRALRIREQQLGPEHPHVAFALNNLATLYVEQGKYIEAESLYQQALHIVEPQLGLDHPYMASTLSNLATLYREQGKYTEAELLYQRALRIWEQRLGPEHPETTVTIHNLARLREVQGNSEEARSLYTRVLSIREQALGKHHPKTTEPRTRLIALLHTMSQDEEAAQLETAWSEYKADEEERKALPEE